MTQTAQAPAAPADSYYSPYELNLFLGYQHFFVNNVLGTSADTFNDGITGGFRITEDFWKYIGIEQSLSIAGNNLVVVPYGLSQSVTANTHNYVVALNPVFYFTRRESKLRPFATVGPGYTFYNTARYLDTSAVAGAIAPGDPLIHQRGLGLIYQIQCKAVPGPALRCPRFADAGLGIRLARSAERRRLDLHSDAQRRKRDRAHWRHHSPLWQPQRFRPAATAATTAAGAETGCQHPNQRSGRRARRVPRRDCQARSHRQRMASRSDSVLSMDD